MTFLLAPPVATPSITRQRLLLERIDAGQTLSFRPELSAMVHWRGNQDLPIHRWYKYREGYSPALIDALQLGARILDPFAGSGSIMVGAAELGLRSTGIDVNPLATFVTSVKLTPLDSDQLNQASGFADLMLSISSVSEAWPQPALTISENMFEPDINLVMMQIRARIEEFADDTVFYNFLLLAWIAVLETVGSYFKEGNGIKYRKKKRAKNSYEDHVDGEWQLKRFGRDQRSFAISTYVNHLRMMVDDGRACWGAQEWEQQQVLTGSANQIMPTLAEESFDSVVFSPPYANRFDYFESLKVELWYGGFVKSYEDLNTLRKSSMRSHLGADLKQVTAVIPDLEDLIESMDADSYAVKMRVPALLRGYFDDIRSVLSESKRVTVKGGRTYVVVGNSAYAGVIIPTDSLVAQVGRDIGFANAKVHVVRSLTVAPQQRAKLNGLENFMRESVVELW
ncbi:SAM-dependent methyltransferase [Cryobacterium sp. TmT2-59]|uniref:SAM-dependent methyltransferase n=1 Tax=Cryobacterium sp. TmT2-59 TaxID=1259264 RepID=UPI00106900C1|nr:SAM-dependent methyltransferase [Cryobacterium sp. TmT2-59]TFC87150.1 SAM-dependent methyltransferase [Cryobacterium sp. TmT2-59]